MLIEIEKPRQILEEGKRRWFKDPFFDLIIWYSENNDIEGFQLCYNKKSSEKALTWRHDGSYTHHGIDDGDSVQINKMSPILVADGLFDSHQIALKFKDACQNIDPGIASFVYDKLIEYK